MAGRGGIRGLAVAVPAAPLIIGVAGAVWLWWAMGHWGDDAADGPGSTGTAIACAQAMEFARASRSGWTGAGWTRGWPPPSRRGRSTGASSVRFVAHDA
ncbi:hypothetical protein [Streptomyces sp. NPDC002209]|uniref:hypothetical protein n=1 Tax=Streptomyces sp. NPDC002209 TaxID=3364638 RepID=UPI003690B94C